MPVEAKRIWVVADDYGIARGVNAAIRDLLAQGAINATSVMVVASGFDEREVAALTALRAASGIAVGLHLTLTAPFRPLVADYAPTRTGSFLPLGETFVAADVGADARRRAGSGGSGADCPLRRGCSVDRPITSMDISTCMCFRASPTARSRRRGRAPPGLDPAVRAAGRSDVGAKALVLDLLSARFRKRAAAAGLRTNPGFAGSYDFGTHADFADLFASVSAGLAGRWGHHVSPGLGGRRAYPQRHADKPARA